MKFDLVSNVYEWNEDGILGALHIEIDGSPFPKNRWSGSVGETLIMWSENLLSLLDAGLNGEEEFFFPDSAYSFTVRQRGASPALLCLLENAKPIDERMYEVSFFIFLNAVSHLTDTLTGDGRFQGIPHVKRLKNVAARLKKTSEAHGYHME